MFAYIFVNTEPGRLWKVAELAQEIDGVKMAHAVTGQFDVVVFGEFPKMDDVRRVIDKIHSIEGVIRTQTSVVVPFRLDSDV